MGFAVPEEDCNLANRGQAHFDLFDDADTIRHKLRIGALCGIEMAFLQRPEVRDIADTLNP